MILMVMLFLVQYASAEPARKLIVAVAQEPTSMDQSLSSAGPDAIVIENWGEYLVYRAQNGELKPGIASAWKVSPDGRVIEFTLRKGIKFHSGDPLTMKDIEFSYDRAAKNPLAKTRLRLMEKLEVVDDLHFRIHLKTPDVGFIPNRGGAAIVSKGYYDRVGEDKFVRNPVGTGPYKFVSYAPGEYVDIERFEDYWGENPSVKEARFYFVPEETTRIARLKAGEVDLINQCPYTSLKEIERTPGLKIVRLSTKHPTVSLIFQNRNPNTPWYDRRVRLAMAYAIDRDAILKNVLQSIPDRWAFLSPQELGFDPTLKEYPYDPKGARDLLRQAGYPKGFDLKLYWRMTASHPMARETAEAVASYLEAVGIRTRLIGEENMPALARLRAAKSPEAEYVAVFAHGRAGGPDPSIYLDYFFSKDGSFSVYSNDIVEKLIAEAKATVNDAKRSELIKKAVTTIHEDVAGVPIFSTVSLYAMRNNIDFSPTQKYAIDLFLIKDVTIK